MAGTDGEDYSTRADDRRKVMSESETGQVAREAVGCNQFFSETFSCELSIKATRTDRIIKLVRADRNDRGSGLLSTSSLRQRQEEASANEQRSDLACVLRATVALKSHTALLEKNTQVSRPLP